MSVAHAKSLTIADFTGTVTAFNSQGSTTTVAASDLGLPSDWNSAHNLVFPLAGNTSNSSAVAGTNIAFAGGNNITLAGSTSANGSATISIHGPAGLAANSDWCNVPFVQGTQTIHPTQSTFYVFPIEIPAPVVLDRMRFLSSMQVASTTFNSSAADTTFNFQQSETHRWVLYQRNSGASSMSLYSVASGSNTLGMGLSMAWNAAGRTASTSFQLSHYNAGGSASFSTSGTTSASTIIVNTANLTAITGGKYGDVPFATTLQPGEYWLAFNRSTTTATTGTNMSGARFQHSALAVSQVNNAFGKIGAANSASQGILLGKGSFTTAAGASTASMGFSNISTSASHLIPVIVFGSGLQ